MNIKKIYLISTLAFANLALPLTLTNNTPFTITLRIIKGGGAGCCDTTEILASGVQNYRTNTNLACDNMTHARCPFHIDITEDQNNWMATDTRPFDPDLAPIDRKWINGSENKDGRFISYFSYQNASNDDDLEFKIRRIETDKWGKVVFESVDRTNRRDTRLRHPHAVAVQLLPFLYYKNSGERLNLRW